MIFRALKFLIVLGSLILNVALLILVKWNHVLLLEKEKTWRANFISECMSSRLSGSKCPGCKQGSSTSSTPEKASDEYLRDDTLGESYSGVMSQDPTSASDDVLTYISKPMRNFVAPTYPDRDDIVPSDSNLPAVKLFIKLCRLRLEILFRHWRTLNGLSESPPGCNLISSNLVVDSFFSNCVISGWINTKIEDCNFENVDFTQPKEEDLEILKHDIDSGCLEYISNYRKRFLTNSEQCLRLLYAVFITVEMSSVRIPITLDLNTNGLRMRQAQEHTTLNISKVNRQALVSSICTSIMDFSGFDLIEEAKTSEESRRMADSIFQQAVGVIWPC